MSNHGHKWTLKGTLTEQELEDYSIVFSIDESSALFRLLNYFKFQYNRLAAAIYWVDNKELEKAIPLANLIFYNRNIF